VAGGVKYIVQNILFKFAVDYKGIYGSDYAAAKVRAKTKPAPQYGRAITHLVSHRAYGRVRVYLPRSPGTS
jgi:hypothetical protein